MGVYIKGMEIPKNCDECRFCYGDTMDGMCRAAEKWFDDDYFTWYAYDEDYINTSKPCNCPLIEVPPHGRLIDADALEEHNGWLRDSMYFAQESGHTHIQFIYANDIINAPTVIEAEDGDLS